MNYDTALVYLAEHMVLEKLGMTCVARQSGKSLQGQPADILVYNIEVN